MYCGHSPGQINRRGFLTCTAATLAASAVAAPGALAASASGLERDVRLGTDQYPQLIAAMGGAYTHGSVQAYVTDVGRRLAANSDIPDLPYEFTVLNTPTVNAWALPGGKIGITRGLLALAGTEAELAGVMAHEVGHATARHGARRQNRSTLANLGVALLGLATQSSEVMQLGQTVTAGVLQSYSRDQEFEADTLGVRVLTRTGYDPAAMSTFLASLREHSQLDARMQGLPPGEVDKFNIMASHPRTAERVREAQTAAAAVTVQDPRVGRDEYLEAINGILFADDPAQGFVRGRNFTHISLGVAFDAPEGFILRNGQTQVTAESKTGAVIVFDMGTVQRARTLVEYLQYEWMTQVQLTQAENLQVNGVPAATAVGRANAGGSMVDVRVVAYQAEPGRVFRFMFITPPLVTAGLGRALRDTTYSFRRITEDDARAVRPLRLITVDVREGDTLDRLASTFPYERFNADWFRLLNDIPLGEDVRPGQRVKIVVG
jgi:predicted Zn-dependent protease